MSPERPEDGSAEDAASVLTALREASLDGILVVGPRDRVLFNNRRFAEIWGFPPDVLAMRSGQGYLEFISPQVCDPAAFRDPIFHLRVNETERFHDEVVLKDKRTFERYAIPLWDGRGHVLGRGWYHRDITERKRGERYQRLASEVLGILNEPVATADAVNRILAAIKRETEFDAVGIRLRNGNDFPYLDQAGFSEEFLLTERSLLPHRRRAERARTRPGKTASNAPAAWSWGRRTAAAQPPAYGGRKLLDERLPLARRPPARRGPEVSTPEHLHGLRLPIHRAHPRPREHNIVGLLQLNDRRENCFTPDLIRFFEGIGASIGVALLRKHDDDALRASEANFRTFFGSTSDMLVLGDRDGTIIYTNPASPAPLATNRTSRGQVDGGPASGELSGGGPRDSRGHRARRAEKCPLPFVTKTGSLIPVGHPHVALANGAARRACLGSPKTSPPSKRPSSTSSSCSGRTRL